MPTPTKIRRPALPSTPQFWEEWIWSRFPPNKYVIQPQAYGVTLEVNMGAVATVDWPAFPAPFYCFRLAFVSWQTSDGDPTDFPVRIGIQYTNGNNWTSGVFASAIIVGNSGNAGFVPAYDWRLPRECAQNDVLTLTVDNTLNPAEAIQCDAMLWGYEVRTRTFPMPSVAFDQIR